MNRKVLVVAVAFMAVAMLATPIVGVYAEKKTSTSYIMMMASAGMTEEWFILIPPKEPFKAFLKYSGLPTGVKLNIGGELVPLGGGVYAVVGGETYELDTDFTYESKASLWWWPDLEAEPPEPGEEPVPDYYEAISWETITFLQESGIKGTLEVQVRLYMDFEAGEIAAYGATINGHGTGDLRGAIINAEWGPPIFDLDVGFCFITHVGTVKGWDN